MSKSPLSVRLASNTGVFLALAALTLYVLYGQWLGAVEWSVAPVTSPLTIITTSPTADGKATSVFFSYRKYRACQFIGADWSVDGKHVDVEPAGNLFATHLPGLLFMVWRVESPTIEKSEVSLIYQCSPLWLTYGKVLG